MDRSRGSDIRHTKEHFGRRTSMNKSDDSRNGLLLANPNAGEDEQPPPLGITKTSSFNALVHTDSKERLIQKGKMRTKSPSFFKMLVGGLRKLSTQELEDSESKRGDSSSFSDNDEPIIFSPVIPDHDKQRIDHIATLPRKSSDYQRYNEERQGKKSKEVSCSSSPEDNTRLNSYEETKPKQKGSPEHLGEDQVDDAFVMAIQDSPSQPEFHSVGLEALEMLHHQLQILVIQDCDSDMANIMDEKVTESLQRQIIDLQQSIACLQQSNQNLQLSLKIAEIRAEEAEVKLHHSSQRCLKVDEKYHWLEKKYKHLHKTYCSVEKHLQKQALLQQMQLSPTKKLDRRPNSANSPQKQRSLDLRLSPHMSAVKRHNSSEFLSQYQQRKSPLNISSEQMAADINPCNTLPTRLHSGSLSHTETRV